MYKFAKINPCVYSPFRNLSTATISINLVVAIYFSNKLSIQKILLYEEFFLSYSATCNRNAQKKTNEQPKKKKKIRLN